MNKTYRTKTTARGGGERAGKPAPLKKDSKIKNKDYILKNVFGNPIYRFTYL